MFGKKSYTVRYSIDPDSDYLNGTLEPGSYRFSALVFGKPSVHGIDNGRISKLRIQDRMGREIVNYQRGFAEINGKPEKLSREQTQLIEAMKKEFPADQTWTPEQQAIFDRNEASRAARPKPEPVQPPHEGRDPGVAARFVQNCTLRKSRSMETS